MASVRAANRWATRLGTKISQIADEVSIEEDALSLALLALAGCSSPKDANKENFGKAIQSYLDTDPALCVGSVGMKFPYQLPAKFSEKGRDAETLNAMLKAGLLTRKEQEVEQRDMFFPREKSKKVPGFVFDVSKEGKKYFKREEGAFASRDEFCTGKWKLVAVENFTEPAQMMGATISRVTYRKLMVDAADWAKSGDLAARFSGAFRGVKGEVQSQDVLVLVNDGWIHERLFKRR